MERRTFLRASALAGAGVALGSWVGWPDPAFATASCLWGARPDPYGTESTERATRNLEAKIGRKLALVREYSAWDRDLPDKYDTFAGNTGRIPYISWHAIKISGAAVSWSSIANGVHDAAILAQAASLKAWGKPAYFCFHHEPENDPKNGNAAQFKAAFSHVHTLFQRVGATNLRWVAAFMASTYCGGHGGIAQWMPATKGLLYGVDGYNRGSCDPKPGWRSFAQIFQASRDYAKAKGHGLFIGEYGCVEDTACGNAGGATSRKAAWLSDAASTIQSWPEVKGVIYSNTEWVFNGTKVNYRVTTGTKSLAAFTSAGQRSYFK
jgi:hypothetical protein